MKKNAQYLANLRLAMKEHAIDCVIISGTDPHQSELPPMHWRGREWLTGFESENGTNGTAVVMSDKAYVWTDSRYFIQATEQLRDTGFEMMKEDGPDAVVLKIPQIHNHTIKNNNGTQFHNCLPLCDFLNFAGFHKQTSVLLNH